MKRKATAQLTREGGYEPEAPSVMPPDCSPEDIQKRKIYRARRPLRQPLFSDDKVGFALKSSLLSSEDEKRLLTDQSSTIDFLSVPTPPSPPKTPVEPPKSVKPNPAPPVTAPPPAKDPAKLFGTPLTSPAFKSTGFKNLIEELNRKQTDEVAQAFIQTKAEPSASPSVVLPDSVTTKTLYKSLLTV